MSIGIPNLALGYHGYAGDLWREVICKSCIQDTLSTSRCCFRHHVQISCSSVYVQGIRHSSSLSSFSASLAQLHSLSTRTLYFILSTFIPKSSILHSFPPPTSQANTPINPDPQPSKQLSCPFYPLALRIKQLVVAH
jgi:hypothetical protein